MGFFHHESEEAKQYTDFNDFAPIREHKSKISHELISGAAAFEAAKAWEDHKKANGEPENHAKTAWLKLTAWTTSTEKERSEKPERELRALSTTTATEARTGGIQVTR
ncbi:hypothetical protein PtB15_1B223 [Puccinia triticina]|nr:hypothetical protein PtB15_1B223 [Puccinia triticina]